MTLSRGASTIPPVGAPPRRRSRLSRSGRRAYDDLKADEAEVDHILGLWPRACEGAGLCHEVDTVSGATVTTPRIVDVTLGPPLILIVRLLPGHVPADAVEVAYRIGAAFGARTTRCTPHGPTHVRFEFRADDPLAAEIPLLEVPGTHLGRSEDGDDLVDDWARMPHTVVQGVTRSGKSGWLYAQLAQLARRDHTVVAGSDPSGLLWRPWAAHRDPGLRVGGLASVEAHAALLERLIADMDRRIKLIPPDRDTVELGPSNPLLVVVLEEYPGLLRAADAADRKLGARVRAGVSRLLAEGHKAGVRVVIVAQRAESNVIGGFERAMCGLRLSFRVDNADSLRLLHPGAAVDRLDEHMSAPAGVALLTGPGAGLVRIRGPWIGGYPAYTTAVTTAT